VVLDVKFMEWAASQGLDTAKLRAAKVPIYGKWYYPELPADVELVNLRSGEVKTFAAPMIAGATLWAPKADLEAAGLWPPRAGEPATPEEAPRLAPLALRPSLHPIAPFGAEHWAPVGTFAILLVYLMVIVGLWLAMYTMLLQRG